MQVGHRWPTQQFPPTAEQDRGFKNTLKKTDYGLCTGREHHKIGIFLKQIKWTDKCSINVILYPGQNVNN